jgi:hypothetical protein
MSMLDRVFENDSELVRIKNPIMFDQCMGANPSGGKDYYVDNNVGTSVGDGSSWKTPMKNLAVAITASNKDIALSTNRWWARRNRIFYCADTETVTLTAFPNKCDVIGVGSYDANTKPGISGNHAPVNAGNYGTRFINVWFKGVAEATPIVDLASTSSGIQFIGCTFDGVAGTVTYAIRATASPFLKVVDCDIFGTFATGYIAFGTGDTAGTVIEGNWMHGSAGLGIATVTGTTSSYQTLIKNNIISTTSTGLCVDDEADGSTGILYLVGNRFMNGATLTNYAGYTGIIDPNIARCVDNICMGADVSMRVPRVVVS